MRKPCRKRSVFQPRFLTAPTSDGKRDGSPMMGLYLAVRLPYLKARYDTFRRAAVSQIIIYKVRCIT